MDREGPRHYIPALGFRRLTPLFDPAVTLFGFGVRERRRVIEQLRLRPGDRVLDLGCGTGTLLALAARLHPNVRGVGVDVDPVVLARAARKLRQAGRAARLVQASASQLPFAESSLDAAVSTLIFHHLPSETKQLALREAARVLPAGGRFLLADFGRADGLGLRLFAASLRLLRVPEAATLADNLAGRLPEFLAAAGFTVEEVEPRRRGVQFLLARLPQR